MARRGLVGGKPKQREDARSMVRRGEEKIDAAWLVRDGTIPGRLDNCKVNATRARCSAVDAAPQVDRHDSEVEGMNGVNVKRRESPDSRGELNRQKQ